MAENKAYDESLRQFRAANYQGAVAAFQAFLDKYPNSSLAPNAHYWIGVSYFNLRDLKSAMQYNQALLTRYPASAKIPDTMLSVANIHIEQGEYDVARATLEEVVERFPTSDAAAKARSRLQLLKK